MTKKFTFTIIALIMAMSLIMSACQPAAEQPAAEAEVEEAAPAEAEEAEEAAPAEAEEAAPAEAEEAEAEEAAPAEAEEVEEAPKQTVKFGDQQWDSLWINNAIAGFIVEYGYGYPVETVETTTPVMQVALEDDEIQVNMEMWRTHMMEWYTKVQEEGSVIDLGPTFEKALQGFYVPRYVIEGDPERGIEPMAPDLKTVYDLAEYWEVFKNPENPDRGVIYNCISGWTCAIINSSKVYAYGLDEYYDTLEPGSSGALDAAISGAFKKGEPIVTYYWEPSWLMGAVDMVLLEEPEYNKECSELLDSYVEEDTPFSDPESIVEEAGCEYETIAIHKAVSDDFAERSPELVEFLSKMMVGTQTLNELSAYKVNEEVSADETALYYFQNYEDWREWLPDDVEAKVDAAVEEAVQ